MLLPTPPPPWVDGSCLRIRLEVGPEAQREAPESRRAGVAASLTACLGEFWGIGCWPRSQQPGRRREYAAVVSWTLEPPTPVPPPYWPSPDVRLISSVRAKAATSHAS